MKVALPRALLLLDVGQNSSALLRGAPGLSFPHPVDFGLQEDVGSPVLPFLVLQHPAGTSFLQPPRSLRVALGHRPPAHKTAELTN